MGFWLLALLIAVSNFILLESLNLGNLSIKNAFLTIENSMSLKISNLLFLNCSFNYAMALELISVQ